MSVSLFLIAIICSKMSQLPSCEQSHDGEPALSQLVSSKITVRILQAEMLIRKPRSFLVHAAGENKEGNLG